MFGREPRLPIDVTFGLPSPVGTEDHGKYATDLRDRIRHAHNLASAAAEKASAQARLQYNKRVKEHALEVGDRVLIRNVGLKGPNKLADRWSKEVFTVLRRMNPSMPVYEVGRVSGIGPKKVLHRNMLLPCGFLPVDTPSIVPEKPVPQPRQRRSLRHQPQPPEAPCLYDSDDSENGWYPLNPETAILPPTPAPRRSLASADLNPDAEPYVPIPDGDTPDTPDVLAEDGTDEPNDIREERDDDPPGDPPAPSNDEDFHNPSTDPVTDMPPTAPTEYAARRPARNRRPPQYYGFPISEAKLMEQHLGMRQQALGLIRDLCCGVAGQNPFTNIGMSGTP